MPEFEEDSLENRPVGRAVYPKGVRVAAIIWMVNGILILLNAVVSFALNAGGGNNKGSCGVIFGGLIGIAFVAVGSQTLKGTAKDTLGNAVGSLLFGFLVMTCGGIVMTSGIAVATGAAEGSVIEQPKAPGIMAIVVGATNLLTGSALLVAGILAIVGRAPYKAWRKAERAKLKALEEDERS
jgi:hypothetical protein